MFKHRRKMSSNNSVGRASKDESVDKRRNLVVGLIGLVTAGTSRLLFEEVSSLVLTDLLEWARWSMAGRFLPRILTGVRFIIAIGSGELSDGRSPTLCCGMQDLRISWKHLSDYPRSFDHWDRPGAGLDVTRPKLNC